ncbi:MAG: sulfotransferase [Mariniblastus sp.]|nr:sulfotransferase [Planctomycetaceae bacterium]MDG1874072.1 sulfotransferase [Mariniblastus sp.]
MNDKPERPIFIVGSPRSGTGFLRNMVRTHPRISIPSESHFIPHFFKSYSDPKNAAEAIRLGRRIKNFGRVREWGLEFSEVEFSNCRKYSEAITLLFSKWSLTEDKPRWGDKTPHYVRHISTLIEIFPNAQILHIIRDPRAVSRSWSKHPLGSGNIYSAAMQWRENVMAGRNAGANLRPESYMEIRYEQLLQNPKASMESVFRFLGESTPSDGVVSSTSSTLPHPIACTGMLDGVKSRMTAWREELTPTEIQLVEAIAADLMIELEYEPTGPIRPLPRIRSFIWKMETVIVHYVRMFQGSKRWKDNSRLLAAKTRRRLLRRWSPTDR